MDKVTEKKKILILFVAIIAFVALIAGGTYAWMSFTGAIVSNNGNTLATCFVIEDDYTDEDGTTSLSGTLIQSSKPKLGLSGTVGMKIRSDCGIAGVGHIYLTVNENTDSVLYKKAPARCENPTTLETMKEYTSSSTCTSNGGTWIPANTHSALKYAVYENVDSDPVSVGYIDGTGKMTLHGNFELSYENKLHYIYIWLDGNLADSTYAGVSFDGYVHLGANQTENHLDILENPGKENAVGDAYAVYSADDNSLRFYRSLTPITVGSTYNGLTVTNVYTDFEDSTATSPPWNAMDSVIKSIVFEDYIYPISTESWFGGMKNITAIDLAKLDTSNVTSMQSMFGSSVFAYLDVSSFDTSNVTSMANMFYNVNITDIVGLESWDTSNVVDMMAMFYHSTHEDLDLSEWNVCKVTSYGGFNDSAEGTIIKPNFGNTARCNGKTNVGKENAVGDAYAVYFASDNSLRFYRSTTAITAGSAFDGRTVTMVYSGFEDGGYPMWYLDYVNGISSLVLSDTKIVVFEDYVYPVSTSYWFDEFDSLTEINLNKLDTSNVTDMSFMFSYSPNLLLIGGIEYLNTSNVTNMSGMFWGDHYLSSLDLSRWDVSNVTNMYGMFTSMSRLTNLDLSGWDVSNVTYMSFMFESTDNVILDLTRWNVCNVTDYNTFSTSSNIIEPYFGNTSKCNGGNPA